MSRTAQDERPAPGPTRSGESSCAEKGCNCIACPPKPSIEPHIGGHCGVHGNGCHRECGS